MMSFESPRSLDEAPGLLRDCTELTLWGRRIRPGAVAEYEPRGAFGAKGIAESPMVNSTAAIVAAMRDCNRGALAWAPPVNRKTLP